MDYQWREVSIGNLSFDQTKLQYQCCLLFLVSKQGYELNKKIERYYYYNYLVRRYCLLTAQSSHFGNHIFLHWSFVMRFDLDDRKKISLLCDLIRVISNGKSNVVFVWHRTEGWAVLQNQEYLDNLDGSHLVNLCSIKLHFFSHILPQNRDFISFELDVSNIARVLKSTKSHIKRMVWHVFESDTHQRETNLVTPGGAYQGQLQINIMMDEGQLEIRKEIFLSTRINANSYFALFREFTEEKTQYLEIQKAHLIQMKELHRNECVFFRFANDYVTAYSYPEENNISIKRTALEKYDYTTLINNLNGKNRLGIPPNFLIPQILMSLKLGDRIQLFIGDSIQEDNISVSLRSKTDSFTFISQFKSVMEYDDDITRHNPFESIQQMPLAEQQQQQQFHQFVATAAPQQNGGTPRQRGGQSPFQPMNYSMQSNESHIQGLTNQMHLADPYLHQHSNNSMAGSALEFNQHQTEESLRFKKPLMQQQTTTARKRVNIINDDVNIDISKNTFNMKIKQEQQPSVMQMSNSANNIYSINSTQQSNQHMNTFAGGLPIRRKHDNTEQQQQNDHPSIPFFRNNATKRIKESNYSESHRFPSTDFTTQKALQQHQQQASMKQQTASNSRMQQQNSNMNPFISQQQTENLNDFSSFISQNAKGDDFSIFKQNATSLSAAQQFLPINNNSNSINSKNIFPRNLNGTSSNPTLTKNNKSIPKQ